MIELDREREIVRYSSERVIELDREREIVRYSRERVIELDIGLVESER